MAHKLHRVYDTVCSPESVIRAGYNTIRGKRNRHDVQRLFRKGYIKTLDDVWQLLTTETFQPQPCKHKPIYDSGKWRVLTIPVSTPDRFVDHCIIDNTEGYLYRLYITNTYACIKGRGIHKCLNDLTRYLHKDKRGTRYCLKLDVRHYYDSIDHAILKDIMARYIGDTRLLRLQYKIIDSVEGGKGLGIGRLPSQHWANLYLTPYDHWVKEWLTPMVRKLCKCKLYYLRYMDDEVFLCGKKPALHWVFEQVKQYKRELLKLEIKGNWQIFPVDARSIDFVGYKSNHYNTLARKSILYRFWRKLSKVKSQYSPFNVKELWQVLSAHNGWLQHCTPKHYRRIISETVNQLTKMAKTTLQRGLHSEKVQPTFDVIDRINGTTLYNHNQHFVETTNEQGKKVKVNEYDSLLVTYPVNANTVLAALLNARYDSNTESKLLNDYNAAQLGIEDESKKQPYLDFLAERKSLRAMVDADCEANSIPLK
ncbi:MAG: reverse transcriptase domain-containing protein [Lachnospiraceae bacterium]|nr:reverse transcriptase domain-containing protein [Lachnospiraceae bacterium]